MNKFLFLPLLLLVPFASHAGTAQAVMHVSVTVVDDCRVSTQALAFPQYQASQSTQASVNLAVTCTRGTAAKVTATSPMQMTDGNGNTLQYQLTSQGQSLASGVSVLGQGATPISLPVQGLIPAGQHVPAGEYQADQVVTVTF